MWAAQIILPGNRIFPLDHQEFLKPACKFQWTQTIETDLVEISAYAMILGNNTKFLVNCLYVAGDFIITSLLDNYY